MAQAREFAEAQPHHHRGRSVIRVLEAGWLIFPIFLLAAIYFVPALRVPLLTFPPEYASQLPWALLGMTVAAVVWLVVDFFVVADRNTSVGSLRLNTAVSIALALALSIYGGYAWSGLPWGYLIPWIASILDAFITADRAINNAAQKPLIQTGKG